MIVLSFTRGDERSGTATGNFASIEQGYYALLLLKIGNGEPRSFFILQVDASVKSIRRQPEEADRA